MTPETAEEFIARKTAEWTRQRDSGKPAMYLKDIGRKGSQAWYRDKWTFHIQTGYKEKVIVLERLRRGDAKGRLAYPSNRQPGDVEYRFGYFTLARNGRAENLWWWGQSALLVPAGDLQILMNRAREDGTLLSAPEV